MKGMPMYRSRQIQSVEGLKIALERCIQEGLSTMDIVQEVKLWVMNRKGVKDVQH
jgi:hypothetical protein